MANPSTLQAEQNVRGVLQIPTAAQQPTAQQFSFSNTTSLSANADKKSCEKWAKQLRRGLPRVASNPLFVVHELSNLQFCSVAYQQLFDAHQIAYQHERSKLSDLRRDNTLGYFGDNLRVYMSPNGYRDQEYCELKAIDRCLPFTTTVLGKTYVPTIWDKAFDKQRRFSRSAGYCARSAKEFAYTSVSTVFNKFWNSNIGFTLRYIFK